MTGPKHPNAGFSLIEVGVVLFILTILLTGIAIPIASQVEARRVDDTRKSLDEARRALLGFASANGRLPCPATATSNGQEAFCTNGTGACGAQLVGYQTHGRCFAPFNGWLPAATLGLSGLDAQGFLVDSWATSQSRVRYAVADYSVNIPTSTPNDISVLTHANGIQKNTAETTANSMVKLYICASGTGVVTGAGGNCGTAIELAKAAALLFSLGPNAATGGTGTDEALNLDNDRVFVARDPGDQAGNAYDDILVWISVNTLFHQLQQAQRLP